MTDARLGAESVEALTDGTPDARLGAASVEALTDGSPAARLGALSVEVLTPSATAASLAAIGLEVLTPAALPVSLITVPITVELQLSGTWTDITSKVYQRDGMDVTRGRRSEGQTADATSCTFTVNNRNGLFSPRNPNGTYYGSIGRNTPVRISIPATTSYLNIPDTSTDGVTAPDSAGLSITGDLELQVDLWASDWRASFDLLGKYTETANQRSYALYMDAYGLINLRWSTDGTSGNTVTVPSTIPVPAPLSGRKAIKATLDVNNGSGGYTVTFYTAATISGSWTQLGDAIATTTGTTSIFDSTAVAYVGYHSAVNPARMYAAKILSGIAGTEKANPDFTAQSDSATSFADSAGNTWTIQGNATLVKKDYRFYGEISEWPARWDTTGTDVYVPITAAGVMRRLGQGARITKSAYYRGCTSTVAPVTALQAYWPCEDDAGATSVASGLATGTPMTVSGTAIFGDDTDSFVCSAPLPNIGTASFTGRVPTYTSTGKIQVRFLMTVPLGGTTNNAILLSLRCGGTAMRWDLLYGTGGTLTLKAYDSSVSTLLTDGPTAFAVDGLPLRVGLSLTQSGSDIAYSYSTLAPGASTGSFTSGTLSSNTISAANTVIMAAHKDMSNVTIGHVTVQSDVTSVFDLSAQLNANSGETAGDRIKRLCAEEGLSYLVVGASGRSTTMGYQTRQTLLTLLRECETTDAGVLYETRGLLGIGYRTNNGLCAQASSLSLSYTAADLSQIEPVEDDQTLTNDVTASRTGGSSARSVLTTGALSTAAPPNGVGLYDTTLTVNTDSDAVLPDHAGWAVHMGTVNEARYPALGVNLARSNYTGNAALLKAATDLDIGDRVTVSSPPAWLPPESISQLALGFTEHLNAFERTVTMMCAPESPYHVGVYNDGTSRYTSDGSTLNGAHSSGTTSLSVVTSSGPLWSHADGDFAIMVDGEEMTVTAISGSSSPQTFTVTRAVNGITKAHSSGATVELFTPAYYGI